MNRLLRWLKGYLLLEITGAQLHRFLNLCTKEGFSIWSISEVGNRKLRLYMKLSDFWKIRPMARTTKTRIRIRKKKGYPIWCQKHSLLKWSPVLLLLLCCGFLYSRTYLWNIRIEGTKEVYDFKW